jgi:hypothetical protein
LAVWLGLGEGTGLDGWLRLGEGLGWLAGWLRLAEGTGLAGWGLVKGLGWMTG